MFISEKNSAPGHIVALNHKGFNLAVDSARKRKMAMILLVSQDRSNRDTYSFALRADGYDVIVKKSIIQGLKEIKWHRPALIIWSIRAKDAMELQAFSALRDQYGQIKVLLILDKSELTRELKQMSDGVHFKGTPLGKLPGKVLELIGEGQLNENSN